MRPGYRIVPAIAAVVLAVSATAFAETTSAEKKPATPASKAKDVKKEIRARVNGEPIYDDDLRQMCYQFLIETRDLREPERSERQKEIIRRELDKLIERELILQEATGS